MAAFGIIAAIAVAAGQGAPDAPFFVPADFTDSQALAPPPTQNASSDRAESLRCLATAISYEAGNEPIAGQEAVAQVILNRTHSRLYPKTVCGVVFQGSTRRTGCQFTFTCDGSLRRPRSARSMALADAVAARVLDGQVISAIGDATHYHADYVAPYWAPSLTRVAKIGAHIFYRAAAGVAAPGALQTTSYASAATVGAAAGAGPALVSRSGTGVVFSPWGLPTLTVTNGGRIRATKTGS